MKLSNKKQKLFLASSSRRASKGFTLIEVLVVIAIIFSLAGIGFRVFFQVNESAKEKETEAIINAVASAMDARAADISSEQRLSVGVKEGFTYPDGDGGDGSTKDLVSYISGDFNKDGAIDSEVGAKTKVPEISPGESGKNSYLDEDDRIVDAWDNPIHYTFPGVYHNEDDGFDLVSAGPDGKFGTDDDIILK